jgi:hypothetical protein
MNAEEMTILGGLMNRLEANVRTGEEESGP